MMGCVVLFVARAFNSVGLAQDGPTATPNINWVQARDGVYVRGGPGLEYDLVGALVVGEWVQPLARNEAGDWILIAYLYTEGWVQVDGVSWRSNVANLPVIGEIAPTPIPRPLYYNTPGGPTYTPNANWVDVGGDGAFVRSGPGQGYWPVGMLFTGDVVDPVARDAAEDWVLVRFGEGYGWIRYDLVAWIGNINALPVVDVPNLTPSFTPVPVRPTATRALTPSRTPRPSLTPVPTAKATFTLTPTATATPTASDTPSATATSTFTPTATSTASPSPTSTATSTHTPTLAPTRTWTATATLTFTTTFTPTRTESPTATPSSIPTSTVTASPTVTPSPSPTISAAVAAVPTQPPSAIPSDTPSPVPPTATATYTPTLTPSATATATITLTPTATATLTATYTLTSAPSATRTEPPTIAPSVTATATITLTPTATATLTATYTPTLVPSVTRTESPTRTPSATATITLTPTAAATLTATYTPTLAASSTATLTPTMTITATVTATSSPTPSATPQDTLTATPTNTTTPTPAAVAFAGAEPGDGAVGPGGEVVAPESDSGGSSRVLWVLGGIIGLVAFVYVGIFAIEVASQTRYREGFGLSTCPVCQSGHLYVDERRHRVLGIPRVRRTVRCDNCRSVLRYVGRRRWRYAVDGAENPGLFESHNGRVLTEQQLMAISPEYASAPEFVDDDVT